MLEKDEMESINNGWSVILILWLAMFISLAVYVFVGHMVGEKVTIFLGGDSSLGILRGILYGISIATLFLTKYMRNLLLKSEKGSFQTRNQINQHPAVAKYITAVVVSLAMSESIGIYGLVLFFLGKNTMDLYSLILLSAVAMFYYRPKKEELFNVAQTLKIREAIG
ncbi:MAG: hypothetical protein SVY10_16420 [Thermodesulfobacteriota bacterium]|nr:hypothetical protein [Thermodesulfobacteriota bacterium]